MPAEWKGIENNELWKSWPREKISTFRKKNFFDYQRVKYGHTLEKADGISRDLFCWRIIILDLEAVCECFFALFRLNFSFVEERGREYTQRETCEKLWSNVEWKIAKQEKWELAVHALTHAHPSVPALI